MAKSGFLDRPSSKIFCLNLKDLKNSLPEALKPSPPPAHVKAIIEIFFTSDSGSGKVFNSQGLKIDSFSENNASS